jgi:hypothetical protein
MSPLLGGGQQFVHFSLPVGCGNTEAALPAAREIINRHAALLGTVQQWQGISSTCYAAASMGLPAKCQDNDVDPPALQVTDVVAITDSRSARLSKRHAATIEVLLELLSHAAKTARVEFRKTWDQGVHSAVKANVATGYFLTHGFQHEPRRTWFRRFRGR